MIFKTEHVEAIYQESESDYLVITFNGATIRADGARFWGDALLKKNKISALGIMSRRPNWFPRVSMDEVLAEVRPILQRYKRICTFGSSMGAYGAIKYSRRFRADTVVAFSPQYSIDPRHKNVRRNYAFFFDPVLNQDVTIEKDDIRGQVFLFFDPYAGEEADAAHFLHQLRPMELIPMPFARHATLLPFARVNRRSEILQLCLAGEVEPVRRLTQLARREIAPALKAYNLSSALLKNHPRWALQLCQKYPELLEGEVLERFCRRLERMHHLGFAIDWARAWVREKPDFALAHRTLAAFLHMDGHLKEARKAADRALQLEPDSVPNLMLLSLFCQEMGEADAAARWAQRALDLKPGPATAQNLARIYTTNGLMDRSKTVLQEALVRHPNHNALLVHLESIATVESQKMADGKRGLLRRSGHSPKANVLYPKWRFGRKIPFYSRILSRLQRWFRAIYRALRSRTRRHF